MLQRSVTERRRLPIGRPSVSSGTPSGTTRLVVIEETRRLRRKVNAARRGWIDPGHGSVRIVLSFPDRHAAFHLVDRIAARRECFVAMRCGCRDRDGYLADAKRPDTMFQCHRGAPRAFRLGDDASTFGLSHRSIGAVLEALDLAAR